MFFSSAKAGIDPDIFPRVCVYDLRHRFASAALNGWSMSVDQRGFQICMTKPLRNQRQTLVGIILASNA